MFSVTACPQLDPAHRLVRVGVLTYILALSAIALLTLGFHFLTDSIVHRQESTARVVNLCGRQRMLAQRIARLALERAAHADFRPDPQTVGDLRASIAGIEASHKALLDGATKRSIASPGSDAVRNVYLGNPWQLDLRMQNFLTHARAIADSPEERLTLRDPDLLALENAVQASLLSALDAAVTANQQTSEHSIRVLRNLGTSITCIMLLVLLAEGLFLYRPLFRRLALAHIQLVAAGCTDPLTGCLNRRAFTHQAQKSLSSARSTGQSLAVIMLDIDRFKAVNDLHGHAVGDRAINAVVHTVLTSVRLKDHLCRMGGEEFALMLPGESIESASRVAERIRAAVELTPITPRPGSTLSLTISLGVACLKPLDASVFDVLGRADRALMNAKATGRNRVQREDLMSHTDEPDRHVHLSHAEQPQSEQLA